MRHADSLLLVWRLAELEAITLKSGYIDSPHFFLGLLKVVDIDLRALLTKKGRLAKGDPIDEIERDVRVVRECFDELRIDTTHARRMLRRILPQGTIESNTQTGRLRRSLESREAFSRAEHVAEVSGDDVRAVHILFALVQIQSNYIERILEEVHRSVGDFRSHVEKQLIKIRGVIATGQKIGLEPLKQTGELAEPDKRPSSEPGDLRFLQVMGRDLIKLAREGKLEPVVGRRREMRNVAQILLQNRKNNVILVGEAGVGKTGVVEGLAQRIVEGEVPTEFRNTRIIDVSMAALVAGTKWRGDFEARLQSLIKAAAADPNLVLFIDEIHLMMGAGETLGGAMDAANILKPALSRGEIRVIGATTTAEYRRFIEKDPAIERRFELVEVCEPTREEALEILRGLRGRIEIHHRSRISDEALNAAVDLSIVYVPDRRLPDKAIDLLDQACAQARLQSLSGNLRAHFRDGVTIGRQEIATVIAHRCGIPVGELTEDEGTRLLNMEDALRIRVKGQDHAIASVSQAIRLSRSGLKNPDKPIGVFLFAGATGSGKTELAKALAEFLFRDEKKFLRVDMSELMDEHSVSKLIGSPPGFLGHEQGGQLTERIRTHPHSVVLFDEIEKAHPKVLDIFLQVFDEGVLTDSKGRRGDFRNAILILTSNLGSQVAKPRRGVGFRAGESDDDASLRFSEIILAEVKRVLRPELVNRITEVIVFQPLKIADARHVVDKFIDRFNERLQVRSIRLNLTEDARDLLLEEGFSEAFGAREIERTMERLIAKPLAEELLRGQFLNGGQVIVAREEGKLTFQNAKGL